MIEQKLTGSRIDNLVRNEGYGPTKLRAKVDAQEQQNLSTVYLNRKIKTTDYLAPLEFHRRSSSIAKTEL